MSLGDVSTSCAIAWGPLGGIRLTARPGWRVHGGFSHLSGILVGSAGPLPDPGVSLCGLCTPGRCAPDVAAEGSRMSVLGGRAGNF